MRFCGVLQREEAAKQQTAQRMAKELNDVSSDSDTPDYVGTAVDPEEMMMATASLPVYHDLSSLSLVLALSFSLSLSLWMAPQNEAGCGWTGKRSRTPHDPSTPTLVMYDWPSSVETGSLSKFGTPHSVHSLHGLTPNNTVSARNLLSLSECRRNEDHRQSSQPSLTPNAHSAASRRVQMGKARKRHSEGDMRAAPKSKRSAFRINLKSKRRTKKTLRKAARNGMVMEKEKERRIRAKQQSMDRKLKRSASADDRSFKNKKGANSMRTALAPKHSPNDHQSAAHRLDIDHSDLPGHATRDSVRIPIRGRMRRTTEDHVIRKRRSKETESSKKQRRAPNSEKLTATAAPAESIKLLPSLDSMSGMHDDVRWWVEHCVLAR